jgi:dUTP pyrophosphatase
MNGTILDRDSIAALVSDVPPLVEAYLSLQEQLQPNGFDLTLRDINQLTSSGSIGRDPEQRELSGVQGLEFDPEGWLRLAPGSYLITFNEIITLPLDLMALGRPRSSLLRSGVSLHTAVWDAGYRGRSQALLVAHHPLGYRVQQGARLLQLVFFRLARPVSQGYQGKYLEENL